MILRRITSTGQRRQSDTYELMVITLCTQGSYSLSLTHTHTHTHPEQWDFGEMMKNCSNKFKCWKTQRRVKSKANSLRAHHIFMFLFKCCLKSYFSAKFCFIYQLLSLRCLEDFFFFMSAFLHATVNGWFLLLLRCTRENTQTIKKRENVRPKLSTASCRLIKVFFIVS